MRAAQAPGRVGPGGDLDSPDPAGASERLYAGLLWLYPGEFRRRYADEMVRLFGDQLRDARASRRPGGTAGTWYRSFVDLVSNAIGEHLRKDRTMAQSLATFEPTRSMRLLGLLGVAGAVLLLWAFISFEPFADVSINRIRLAVFSLAGAAVAIAFYRRQATVAPRLAFLTTAAVVTAGIWYLFWIRLSENVPSPFSGAFGAVNFLANIALWISAGLWAVALLRIGAAWRGMSRALTLTTKVGAVVLIGSLVGWLGDDRLGLVGGEQGEMWSAIALLGVAANGLGWLLLGTVLLVGGRRATPPPLALGG